VKNSLYPKTNYYLKAVNAALFYSFVEYIYKKQIAKTGNAGGPWGSPKNAHISWYRHRCIYMYRA
jgi:hypothetical protein